MTTHLSDRINSITFSPEILLRASPCRDKVTKSANVALIAFPGSVAGISRRKSR